MRLWNFCSDAACRPVMLVSKPFNSVKPESCVQRVNIEIPAYVLSRGKEDFRGTLQINLVEDFQKILLITSNDAASCTSQYRRRCDLLVDTKSDHFVKSLSYGFVEAYRPKKAKFKQKG